MAFFVHSVSEEQVQWDNYNIRGSIVPATDGDEELDVVRNGIHIGFSFLTVTNVGVISKTNVWMEISGKMGGSQGG